MKNTTCQIFVADKGNVEMFSIKCMGYEKTF